jgi:DNA-binding response OmpR family regulator
MSAKFLVCDENPFTRRLVADVLAGAGYRDVLFTPDGVALLKAAAEVKPRIVITTSRVPGLSGLDFTRIIRAGHGDIDRALSIIVMTDTPTQKFMDAARDAGADELLVRPFSGQALLARVNAVLLQPRPFVECASYVGPCRRRRMVEDEDIAMRREGDAAHAVEQRQREQAANLATLRQAVLRIGELAVKLVPGDWRGLQKLYTTVLEVERLAENASDSTVREAARSFGRYLNAISGAGVIDQEVVGAHVDALQRLSLMDADPAVQREEVVRGLIKVVDKRLGRSTSSAGPAA